MTIQHIYQTSPTIALLKPKEKANDHHAANKLHSFLLNRAFLAFILCGIAGVSIDIDHLISYLAQAGLSARFLHLPVLYGVGIVLCVIGASLGGLFLKAVLRRRERTTTAGTLRLQSDTIRK